MGLAIFLEFDIDFTQAVYDKQEPKSEKETSNYGNIPHLSLVVMNANGDKLKRDLINVLENLTIQPMEISFVGLGVFPGVEPCIYLNPKVDQALLQLHKKLHQLIEQHQVECKPYYLPENWVPHTCLNLTVKPIYFEKRFYKLQQELGGLKGKVKKISLGQFEPYGQIWSKDI